MTKELLVLSLLLVLVVAGCSQPVGETPVTPATDQDTPEAQLPDPTSTPLEATPPETQPQTPTTEMEETPEVITDVISDRPIVYGNWAADPSIVVLLDPLNGDEIKRLEAPGLGFAIQQGVTETGIFYLDDNQQSVFKLYFDGSVEELGFLHPDGEFFEGVVLPSPDGQYVAHGRIVEFDEAGAQVQLTVSDVDGSNPHILLDERLSDRVTRPTPIKWSNDGLSIYYMNVFEGVGGYGGTDLYRISILTGDREEIFPDGNCLCSTSISPDESSAVRVMQDDGLIMLIKDLDTGDEATLALPDEYLEAWEMVWSPDSSQLLITLGQGDWLDDLYGIIQIDIASLTTTTLVDQDTQLYRASAWHVMETVWLSDGQNGLWMMDVETRELSLIASNMILIQHSQ